MNPFEENQFVKVNNPTYFFPLVIEQDSAKVFEIGSNQYKDYVISRFWTSSADVIKTVIHKNKLKLPKDAKAVLEESPQIKLTPSVMTKLRDACNYRVDMALELFNTEFTGYYKI